MSESLRKIYEEHHGTARRAGFSIMKSDRGAFFSESLGTGKSILDLGCRDGALTSFFVKGNKVTGVDIDEVSLARASESLGIETFSFDIQSDWSALNGKKFDAAVAGEFLEHVYYPQKIMGKVAEILTADGVFVGSVPNAFSLKNRLKYLFAIKKNTPMSDPTHINQFSSKELKSMLRKHFSEVEIVGMGRLGKIARISPQLFAFDLCFVARQPLNQKK
ncbi:MAG: class I SAM-dependent methyltransferase [Patescibacteria group bacterium]